MLILNQLVSRLLSSETEIDNRYHDQKVVSHSSLSIEAIPVTSSCVAAPESIVAPVEPLVNSALIVPVTPEPAFTVTLEPTLLAAAPVLPPI